MNKKVIFWLVVGFLIVIDGGLIVYQFVFNKPKADVVVKPNAVDIRQFNLLPTSNPNINAPLVNFANATNIYTPEANFFYASPVLLKRDGDNLLFLARGQASVKY